MSDEKCDWTTPTLLVMSSGNEATIPKIIKVGECFSWDGNEVCIDYVLDEQGES